MGAVYVADQISTGKTRALKVMRPELLRDARLRERFIQEARVGAHIQSDHVVEVLGAGVEPGSGMPWIAMELLDGVDLAQFVRARGVVTAAQTSMILGQMGHALASAHRGGIVHRDLKPENIFIATSHQRDKSYIVKLLDFGVAKLMAEAQAGSNDTSAVGTPRWMAPEQTDAGQAICAATDIWALGLLAFFMLTGRYYWLHSSGEGASVPTLLREILFEPLVPASQRAHQLGVGHLLPPGFDAWFGRCVVRPTSHRFPEAASAVAALESILGTAPGASTPPPDMLLSASAAAGAMPPAAHTAGSEVPGITASTGALAPSAAAPTKKGGTMMAVAGVATALCLALGGLGYTFWDQIDAQVTGSSDDDEKRSDDNDDDDNDEKRSDDDDD